MAFSDSLIVLVAALSLVSLIYGFWRDNRRSDRDEAREQSQLRLDNLRLELQLDAANREVERLEREMERVRSETGRDAHGGISVSGNAQVTVGRDAVGGNKGPD